MKTILQHIGLAAALLFSATLFASDLGSAKAQGLVGETANGYLGAVKASSQTNALITDINQQRKARYQSIAKKNGISLEAVEVRAGQKAIEKTPSGQYVDTGTGWRKK